MSVRFHLARVPAPSAFSSLLLAVAVALAPDVSNAESERRAFPRPVAPTTRTAAGATEGLVGSAVVNFAELARIEALGLAPKVAPRVLLNESGMEENEMDVEPGANVVGPPAPRLMFSPPPFVPFAASPLPGLNYQGLDDIASVDSMNIVIPPAVAGGVGPAKVMESFNNNYRIRDKATGATLLTVGIATFWNPVVTNKALLNQLTYPRTCYDPIQNRWLVAMQTTNNPGIMLFGVSFSSDPAGSWYLYAQTTSFNGGAAPLLDFPILGFNKNWVVMTINAYTSAPVFSCGGTLIANYLQARSGTLGSVTLVTQAAGTHFVTAPCATLSATEDTLFLVTHLSSAGATYQVDRITGTPAAPVYTSGGTSTRPGGGWTQPSGNLLPQSAPNSGASACITPCPIETQDAQVRSAPVFRLDSTTGRQFIYYTQTIQLSAPTRTAVQWTKITASTTPAFADGGRINDGTGASWYAYPHIAVNSVGDFIVGYSRFGAALHPSAAYSVHFAAEGLGTIRDPLSYKVGNDYYHKTFTTTTDRNRWGDFSTAQVDPSDDRTLWTLQEYARTRTGTDDGNTHSNSSRWSSWWAAVTTIPPTATIAPGPALNEGDAGTTAFNFTVNLSGAYGLPVTVDYQTSDALATVADNDYQADTSSIVVSPGNTSGPITVLVNGDRKCEAKEDFKVTLTGATNGTIGAPSVSSGKILNDEVLTVTATAGAGGAISPGGSTAVACGGAQGYTITPNSGFVISDVKVDGLSVGAVAGHTFSDVQADHTIEASFTENVAVQEASFVAKTVDEGVELRWDFNSPVPPESVTLERWDARTGTWLRVAAELRSEDGATIALDRGVAAGATYTYRLSVTVMPGMVRSFGPVVGTAGTPIKELALTSVAPNPTSGSVQIEYAVPREGPVQVRVLDVEGRAVAVLASEPRPRGRYHVVWRGQTARGPARAGIYFVQLQAAGGSVVRRLALIR